MASEIEEGLETKLQLNEIRKAKSDLERAFDFRRSVNFDEEMEAVAMGGTGLGSDTLSEGEMGGGMTATTPASTATTQTEEVGTKKRRKVRRVRRKRVPVVEEEAVEEPMGGSGEISDLGPADFPLDEEEPKKQQDYDKNDARFVSPEEDSSRFQQQLDADDWNSKIMAAPPAAEDADPLSSVQRMIAELEEQREREVDNLRREYEERERIEEKYYAEKLRLLRDAKGDFEDSSKP